MTLVTGGRFAATVEWNDMSKEPSPVLRRESVSYWHFEESFDRYGEGVTTPEALAGDGFRSSR